MKKKPNYQRWVLSLLGALTVFVLINAFIWLRWTRALLAPGDLAGDLTRIGYITGSSYESKERYRLPRKHLHSTEYAGQAVDVITIGDSFSNSCGALEDRYYQDWIATLQGLSVLNIQALPQSNYIETIHTLLDNGYLEKIKPRTILIQAAERQLHIDFGKPITPKKMSLKEVEGIYASARYVNPLPEVSFINIGNFKFALYHFLYRLQPNAFFSKVYSLNLNRPLFRVKNSSRLIFCYEDFANLKDIHAAFVDKLNTDLNALADRLQRKRIRLYFMPVVDKYNLYSDHVVNNPYPKSIFFEEIRKRIKRYTLIDTKMILREGIQQGDLDTFYADETHWSAIAPKRIFSEVSLVS